jgi:hypothetical protein
LAIAAFNMREWRRKAATGCGILHLHVERCTFSRRGTRPLHGIEGKVARNRGGEWVFSEM